MKPTLAPRSRRRSGFTLLEVIVAVAILGLALTAIFASESGSLRTAARARHTQIATLLARCKMGEIEEQVLREGFPAIDDRETDECCEGAEVEGYACAWTIEQITLPTSATSQETSATAGRTNRSSTEALEGAAGEAIGQIGTMGDFLAGGGDRGGLENLFLELAVPVLTPAIEAQVRRVTVNVSWREGDREYGFDVAQYLVNEQQQNAEVIERAARGQTGTTPGTQVRP